MKHLTLILTLFFSTLMFASPAYADWEAVAVSADGDTYYVDFERMRTNGSNVYFWVLEDYLKPEEDGDLSSKVYHQSECEMFRLKMISVLFHKQPMGEGSVETYSPPNPEWMYPPPTSAYEIILKEVCRRSGL